MNHLHLSAIFERELLRVGNTISYLQYDTATVKNKYGESKRKSYLAPVPLNALVNFDPKKEELEEFGVNKEKVRLTVKVLTKHLDEALVTASTDDVVEINGERFFIISLASKGRTEDKPIFTLLGCSKESDNRGL